MFEIAKMISFFTIGVVLSTVVNPPQGIILLVMFSIISLCYGVVAVQKYREYRASYKPRKKKPQTSWKRTVVIFLFIQLAILSCFVYYFKYRGGG